MQGSDIMNKNVGSSKSLFVIFAVILVFAMVVSACTAKSTWTPPPTTPPLPVPLADTPVPPSIPVTGPQNSVFTLSDGSKIILKPDADVKVMTLPGIPAASTEVMLQINHGEIMVIPNPDSKNWFTVLSSKLNVARIQGCAMVVNFDEMSGDYGMKCIGGKCEAGVKMDTVFQVPTNMELLFQGGIYQDPTDVDFAKLTEEYGDVIPACVAEAEIQPIPVTGGETPTVAPDFGATATSVCSDFHKKFPATPCP
jgi:hypothetical protein